jgi:small-conductance mechanosensitive channel
MTDAWQDFVKALGIALLVAVVIIVAAKVAVQLGGRRWEAARQLERRSKLWFRLLVLVVAVTVAVRTSMPQIDYTYRWDELIRHTLQILTILAIAGVVASVLLLVEDSGLRRYDVDVPDNRLARRARTQMQVVRRLTVAAVIVVAMGAVLLTFDGVRAVGASVLASAGVLSIVAGLAAQSTLANVIAGIQIAFSDSIRLDDAVIVEEEWGWIEEITLTYVVVRLWDDRRLVLPSTYFTTTPFQNWTRTHSELLGAVELDLDWGVSPHAMRDQLDRVLADTDLWDGRTKVLQVTDAVNGWVRVRILVTAKDAPSLFDLRCHVRERMVEWLGREHRAGLPRFRVENVQRTVARRGDQHESEPQGLFSGDAEAEARAARVTGQIPVVEAELPERAERPQRTTQEGHEGDA